MNNEVLPTLKKYIDKYKIDYKDIAFLLDRSYMQYKLVLPGYVPTLQEYLEIIRLINIIRDVEKEIYRDKVKKLLTKEG